MKKSTLTVLIIVVVALVVVGGGLLLLKKDKKHKYRTTPVTRGEILSEVSATGTINPVNQVTVGSQVSGIVDTVLVDYNDLVKYGQVLARIDPRNYQAALEQAQANLTSAQVSLDQAERDYRNGETLAKAGLISGDQQVQNKTTYELAAAKVQQAQASYDQAATNLAYTTITSPMTGMVVARSVDNGQTVAASFQSPDLFTIADLSKMQVEVSIQEADVGKLDTTMLVESKVDAYPDKTFEGRLVQIRNNPVVSQNVVTYVGIVQLANPDLLLKPGMTADVKIQVNHVQNTLVVPTSALNAKMGSLLGLTQSRTGGQSAVAASTSAGSRAGMSGSGQGRTGGTDTMRTSPRNPQLAAGDSMRRPSGGRGSQSTTPDSLAAGKKAAPVTRTVYVLDKGKPTPRQVVLGASDSYNTEIKSGLNEGDLVILGLDQGKTNPFMQQGSTNRPPTGGFGPGR